jgi:hypothetical protein
MRALIVAALLAAGPASADLVYKGDGANIRLMDTPCNDRVKRLILAEWQDRFKAGLAIINGRALRVCWVEDSPGSLVLIDEDGDGGRLPKEAFKDEPGA